MQRIAPVHVCVLSGCLHCVLCLTPVRRVNANTVAAHVYFVDVLLMSTFPAGCC
jgi:hypothetical protein